MARKFGIITNVDGLSAGIVVNSISRDETAEIAEARNEKGKVTDLHAYSLGRSISVQGVIDDAKGTLVTAGSKLTLGTENFIVESVNKPETNTAFCEATINARNADSAEITPLDAGADEASLQNVQTQKTGSES